MSPNAARLEDSNPMHIVIDGYNLIRRSRRLSAIEEVDLQAGREALVDALAAYRKEKPFPVTVVFDGGAALPGLPKRDRLKGIRLRYSRGGELADDVIKRIIAKEKSNALVVSSDMEIVSYARTKGAATIDSAEFDDRLEMARYMDVKGGVDTESDSGRPATTKKRGPSRRLPKRKRRMNKVLSKL